jgi:hypothetical protein
VRFWQQTLSDPALTLTHTLNWFLLKLLSLMQRQWSRMRKKLNRGKVLLYNCKIFFQYWGTSTRLQKATISFVVSVCLSVCPFAWNNSAPTRMIFTKFYIWAFFENLSKSLKISLSLTKITNTLLVDIWTFIIMFCWIVLRIRNIPDKTCREKHTCYVQWLFFAENRDIY